MINYVQELQTLISTDRVSTNETMLEQHSHDESYHTPHVPDVVVFPENKEEVSKILAFANENRIPIVPFGVGSSLEGHVIPYQGGISVDFTRMNQIIEIKPEDFYVTVQPGITRKQLNRELKKYGLFFSVEPGSDATLGGMAATNASGTNSVRYGIMRDQVLDLEVVLADGRIIHTGSKAAKSSSGYHLNGLFVGSEGTLGCFTELTLRVNGIPEFVLAARVSFPDAAHAIRAVIGILSAGIPMAKSEFLDIRSIQQFNKHTGLNFPEETTLFLEFHGNEAGLKEDVEFMKEIVAAENSSEIIFETDPQARTQLWEVRHDLAYAFMQNHLGKRVYGTDVCVPMSELAGAIENSNKALDDFEIDGAIFGHVGDGNYHVLFMIDVNDQEYMQRVKDFSNHIVEYALTLGGTCTGEHGVGVGKLKYQQQEHGEAFNIMVDIKKTLDPNNILNPGKKLG